MARFEDEDKSRLFDTLGGSKRSLGNYLKAILPVALAVSLIGVIVIYFSLPDIGDEVSGPAGLKDAIHAYFLNTENRPVTDASYFYCKEFYWVRVGLETRPDIPARRNDTGKRRVIAVENASGSWEISSIPVVANEADVPCTR